MITIKTFAFNLLQENTYVVSDDTLECVIIDCGAYYDDERKAITEYIDSRGLKPVHLLATHGHWDHNLGIDTIYQTYGLQVEAAKEDDFIITDIPRNFQSIIGAPLRREYPPVGRYFSPGEVISFGNHSLQVLKTPGHSPGSVVFYCAEEHTAFTGDTLFRMSVGRTDFEGGSYTDLMASLVHVLAKLPSDTVVLPGHGPQSTIDYELHYNPYLQTF
jgi:glyoxylase-like metal-dependent hydrolase (beta-lactamase superfamily II)